MNTDDYWGRSTNTVVLTNRENKGDKTVEDWRGGGRSSFGYTPGTARDGAGTGTSECPGIRQAGRSARPGLWLKGEVVRAPVTNWDWVNEFEDPFGENATSLETRTWYGIPHSVRVLLVPRGDELYLQSSTQTCRLNKKFPNSKAWWRNVERDLRVRLKIGGKIYEMTVVLIQDRAEVARLRGGRDPIVKEIDADGNKYINEMGNT